MVSPRMRLRFRLLRPLRLNVPALRTVGWLRTFSALSSVSLFFIGAVLFVNGLVLHGRIEPKGAAPVNAFIGVVLVAAAGHLALPTGADEAALVGATGFLLFGVTYLWVALNAWTGHPTAGLGWYCAWATVVSVFVGLVTLIHEDDTKFALLWLLWALLFATFFIVMALDRSKLNHAAGWLAIMEATVTATVPGGLLMIGQWDDLATAWMAIAAAGVVGVFLVLAHQSRPAT
jgi:hypothetical protein